ncbi:MAG: Gfo/Idh/MocA family oxidoreductase [Armatimonadota bacterium]
MKIGLVGSQNSHAGAYGKALNVENQFPGYAITHLWGETPESAYQRAAEVQISTIVDEVQQMVGAVDAVIIDTRYGANHPAQAEPFLATGIPIFIDKPLASSTAQGAALLEKAAAAGAPIDCHSIIPLQRSFREFVAAAEGLGKVTHLTLSMPAAIDSEYAGMFFYTVHAVECLCIYPGGLPRRVRVERFAGRPLATLDYSDGPLATINLQEQNYQYSLVAVGEKESLVHRLVYDDDVFRTGTEEIIDFFAGKRQPPSADRLLMPLRILDALEASKATGEWVEVK